MNSFKIISLSNKFIKQYLFFTFFIFLFFQHTDCNSQNSFRRHFIIACDASKGFNSRNQTAIVGTQNWLEDYFINQFPPGTNGNFDIIREELRNNKLRFDPFKDEITFYNFNLTENDIASIITGEQDSLQRTSKIPEFFFKNPGITWTTFPPRNIYEYFTNTYNPVQSKRELTNFTIPNFVYPLILNSIDKTTFAEEYILIILTGTTPGPLNIVDRYELKRKIGKENIAENYLNNQIKSLSSNFTKTDYFNCPDYGIFAYFITPKNVDPGTAATAISIDSDIKLTQKGYESNKFEFSTIKMNLPQNKYLVPSEIKLKIIKQTKNNGDTIFSSVINTDYYVERWSVKLLHNVGLMENKSTFSNNLKKIKADLVFINLKRDKRYFDSLKLLFEFKCQAKTLGNNALNYLFYAESLVPIGNIDYVEDYEIRFRRVILPIAAILVILIILIVATFRGKIKDLKLNIEGFNDNYMAIENQKVSKYDCWFWQGEYQNSIRISGEIIYNDYKFKIKVKPRLECKIEEIVNNNKFEYTVNDDWINNGCNKWILMDIKNNKYKFSVDVRVKNGIPDFDTPTILKFNVAIRVSTKLFGITPEPKDKDYEFGVREYIGKLWVGLDPGTCGSCITVGNGGPITQPNIFEVFENRGRNEKKYIIPSKLILDNPSIINKSPDQMDHRYDYKWGFEAENQWIANVNTGNGNCYQSIKKLLGYKNSNTDKDSIIAQFQGNNTKKFKGIELAYLLLKGLSQTLDDYLSETIDPAARKILNPNGLPEPLRAVVAVPNNFTLPRIQEMVDSIKMLKRFKEIRYIYETEGILFSYMSKKLPLKTETVMVYDMGGATINASIFKIIPEKKEGNNIYVVETLGRIGFAGGGDNIDVALMESIFKISCVKKAFEQQYGLKTEDDLRHYKLINKSKILAWMFELKLDIVKLRNEPEATNNSWSSASAFSLILFRHFGLKIETADWKDEDLKNLLRVEKYVINLVASNDFGLYVYGKVMEAVGELVKSVFESKSLEIEKRIDKLIFSGRSILFPNIKNGVVETLTHENINFNEWTGFDGDEIKSAVAYGACWYGMYSNIVHLDHTHVTSNYGFLHTNNGETDFVELIKMNSKFNNEGFIENEESIKSNFAENSNQVDFYQIMGGDPKKVVNNINENKHKMNFLGRAPIDVNGTESIKMSLDNNDNVRYEVKLGNKVIKSTDLQINTRDITEDNDWAYVFSVSDDEIKIRVKSVADNGNIV